MRTFVQNVSSSNCQKWRHHILSPNKFRLWWRLSFPAPPPPSQKRKIWTLKLIPKPPGARSEPEAKLRNSQSPFVGLATQKVGTCEARWRHSRDGICDVLDPKDNFQKIFSVTATAVIDNKKMFMGAREMVNIFVEVERDRYTSMYVLPASHKLSHNLCDLSTRKNYLAVIFQNSFRSVPVLIFITSQNRSRCQLHIPGPDLATVVEWPFADGQLWLDETAYKICLINCIYNRLIYSLRRFILGEKICNLSNASFASRERLLPFAYFYKLFMLRFVSGKKNFR